MTMQSDDDRRTGAFPTDRPLEALKADHQFVKKLFDRYLNTQDMNVKKDAGPRAIELVEMHAALEEGVFYPQVRQVDPSLVDHCEDEHQQAKDMIAQLKRMNQDDPQYEQLYRQFADAVSRHIDEEEQQLFPKVEQSNIDMTELGVQMQTFESTMMADMARASERPRMRP